MSTTLPLTPAQVEEYFREGYLVVPGLVPHEAIDRVLEVTPTEGANGGWTPVIFDHDAPTRDAALHRLLVEPSVVGAVEQIFEAPARVYYGMLAVVPAHGGNGLPWHQDNQYNQVLGNALNVFIALCDVTPDKANLWVAPRSHLKGVQPSRPSDLYNGAHREAAVAPDNGVALPALKKGDACIFDRSMYHRSLKNETGEPRYAYAAQYMAEYSRMAATGAKDPRKMPAAELRAIWETRTEDGGRRTEKPHRRVITSLRLTTMNENCRAVAGPQRSRSRRCSPIFRRGAEIR